MELTEWFKMTPAQRVAEVGDEPPCPFCEKPRVTRSDYIRCNPCGMNWVNGTDIFKHPHTRVIASATPAEGSGAQTANAI